MNEITIGSKFLQKCGDTIEIIKENCHEKGHYFFDCKFLKYPYILFKIRKDYIIKGQVINPQIEKIEFIDKIWPQNCGDSLKILEKSEKSGYWKCIFIKYPNEIEAQKSNILKGTVNNSFIEKENFLDKIWIQNCGDSLKIINKSDKKQGSNFLYNCEFIKYPCKIISKKDNILLGNVSNPVLEELNFIEKIWLQNCGDSLKILEKSNLHSNTNSYWRVYSLIYKNDFLALKSTIKNGNVLNPILKEKYEIINSKDKLKNYIRNKNFSFYDLSMQTGISISYLSQKIHEFNLEKYIVYHKNIQEEKIFEYIYKLNNNVIKEDTKKLNGKEIDIYLPDLKLGFEYNGNFWHSNDKKFGKENDYHQKKSLLAKEKGINLFHIWEWEIEENINKIEEYIKSKLGIFEYKIGARKCNIKEISYKEYANFCEKNHLQGSCGAKIKLGLYLKDELIQIMSFGVPRFNEKYEWEIIRECSKSGYCILGGKEKLWKYFVKKYEPNNCISYCDFSKFTGESYLKLGFKLERLNKAGFVWYDNKNHKKYLRTPWKNKEYQNKEYLKLYDCGQLVFTFFNEKL